MNFLEMFAMVTIATLYINWVIWMEKNNIPFSWGP